MALPVDRLVGVPGSGAVTPGAGRLPPLPTLYSSLEEQGGERNADETAGRPSSSASSYSGSDVLILDDDDEEGRPSSTASSYSGSDVLILDDDEEIITIRTDDSSVSQPDADPHPLIPPHGPSSDSIFSDPAIVQAGPVSGASSVTTEIAVTSASQPTRPQHSSHPSQTTQSIVTVLGASTSSSQPQTSHSSGRTHSSSSTPRHGPSTSVAARLEASIANFSPPSSHNRTTHVEEHVRTPVSMPLPSLQVRLVPLQEYSSVVTAVSPPTNNPISQQSAAAQVLSAIRTLTSGTSTAHVPPATTPVANPIRVLNRPQPSPAEFRTPKRRRLSSPAGKSTGNENNEEDDGDCCPICFESWTTSGVHRIASLKCGHLFGQSCIEKWLRGQGGKCPHCNAKAKRADIRVIYAKIIKAMDTSERDRALQDLEKEREIRRKVELELAQTRLQFQIATEDCNKYRLEIDRCKKDLENLKLRTSQSSHLSSDYSAPSTSSISSSQAASKSAGGNFILDKSLKIWEAGGCRVMAYCEHLATLVISQPSSSPLFPGFGIKKLSTVDFKTCQYLTIHTKTIRDMCFHPTVNDGMLLSCSMDKTVKITSVMSNAVVQSYETPVPVWSCMWNANDANYFYAGLQNGSVLEYDIRNTVDSVRGLNSDVTRAPVVSLQYVPIRLDAEFKPGGLLIGQLDRVSFYEKTNSGDYKLHLLPQEGSLTSLSFEPETRHVLASFRPNVKYPNVRHLLCELSNLSLGVGQQERLCTANTIQVLQGGATQKILAKTILMSHPDDKKRLFVCSGDEITGSVQVWDAGMGACVQKLTSTGPIVDICNVKINNDNYLLTLNDKSLRIYKWNR